MLGQTFRRILLKPLPLAFWSLRSSDSQKATYSRTSLIHPLFINFISCSFILIYVINSTIASGLQYRYCKDFSNNGPCYSICYCCLERCEDSAYCMHGLYRRFYCIKRSVHSVSSSQIWGHWKAKGVSTHLKQRVYGCASWSLSCLLRRQQNWQFSSNCRASIQNDNGRGRKNQLEMVTPDLWLVNQANGIRKSE